MDWNAWYGCSTFRVCHESRLSMKRDGAVTEQGRSLDALRANKAVEYEALSAGESSGRESPKRPLGGAMPHYRVNLKLLLERSHDGTSGSRSSVAELVWETRRGSRVKRLGAAYVLEGCESRPRCAPACRRSKIAMTSSQGALGGAAFRGSRQGACPSEKLQGWLQRTPSH